jgi:hypothetical protein
MAFTGNENHDITLSEAAAMTANYRNDNPDETIAHYFGKSAIIDIFNQSGCVGMRVYYAIKDTGEKQLVIVGVDADGNDLYNGKLADRSFNCPSDCSAANPLNT